MELLYAGIALFVAIHVLPTLFGLRERAVAALGENLWKSLYSLITVGAIVLMVMGWQRSALAGGLELAYLPPAWGRHLTMVLMFASFWLLVGRRMGSNLKRFTAHPMLWGIVLWAGAHLLANGEQRSLVLFGSLGAYALFAMWWQGRRGKASKATQAWPLKSEFYAFSVTLAVYTFFLSIHGWIAGVPLLPS